MKNQKIWYQFVLVIMFFVFLFFINKEFKENFKYVKIGDVILKTEIASTPKTQTGGLSGRIGLKEHEGMLFIFDKPSKYLFWMKDMNFAIDMIWLDENLKVIYIKKNATPESYPEAFGPEQDTKYVLEVISGFSDKYNIKEGDSVLFE